MPSPDGCFVQVWDGANRTGTSDYINGPRSYADLREVLNGRRWHNRIASIRAGTTARALVYTAANFEGSSLPVTQGTDYSTLPEGFAGRTASLRVDCTSR